LGSVRKLLLALIAGLVLAAPAAAVAPTLAVSALDRRPQATFSAPFASDATIYFASKPDRATDGQFFTENVETLDFLTDDELAAGKWVSERRLDPGTYYVLLRASPDFDRCYLLGTGGYDPACADGYSNVATLTVPKPVSRYTASARVLRYLGQVNADLRASPLGEKRAYRVCYTTTAGKRRCTAGTLDGYSWDSSATDTLRLSTRLMPTSTTLTWWVGTRKVATRILRVR
jgi:hypothetical protein